MIYLDKELTYPSNTIINDAACRPYSDIDSYSPIESEIYDKIQSFREKRSIAFDFIRDESKIMESLNYKDVEYEKLKGKSYIINDDGSYISEDEIKRLDDVIIEDIVDYFVVAWNTWQYKQDMNRSESSNNTYGAVSMHDNADEEIKVLLDDLEVDDEFVEKYNEEEVIENVQRLIYYLKLLQELSAVKGFSAIQTLILIARFGNNRSLIANSGLYKIDARGRVIGVYSSSCNTAKSFIDWMDLCSGVAYTDESKRWCNIVIRFKEICDSLGINLANEEPSDYMADYVDKQTVLYLMSNEEYIDTVGRIDKNVLAMLEPNKLFTVRTASMCYEDQFINVAEINKVIVRFNEVYDELEALAEYTNRISTNSMAHVNNRIKEIYDQKEDVSEALMLFLIENVLGVSGGKNILRYYRTNYYFNNDNVLWFNHVDKDDEPFTINTRTLRRFFNLASMYDFTCYVTISGCLVYYDYNKNNFKYILIEEMMKGNAEIKDL